MSQYTFTLQSIDSTYTDQNNPNTNYNSASVMKAGYGRAYVKFSDFPASYKKKKIIDLSLYAYCYNYGKYDISMPSELGAFSILVPAQNLDFSELTYNKFHGGGRSVGTLSSKSSISWANESLNVDSYIVRELIQRGISASPWASDQCTFYLQKSKYAPYIQVVAEDYPPNTQNHSPSSGFIDEKSSNTFRWDIVQTKSVEPIGQSLAVFRWKQTGQSAIHTINVSGSKTEVTVPADTFTGDSIQWQIQVTSDDGVLGVASDWMTLTTQDSVSRTVLTYPVEAYLDGSKDNVFQWKHVISTGTPQSRYDLQYSSDSGQSWLDLDSAQTAQTSTIIPADTFPAGQLLWKARTYNSDGVPGDWSEPAAIIVRAAPPEPVLTIGEVRPRPLFQWQATGQASWCLTVYQDGEEIYTTGEMPGEEKSFRITKYLANGIYEAALWVKNLYELQSPTAKVSFTLEAQPPPPPYLTVQAAENKAVLTISGAGFYRYYIFRDDVLVYKMDAPGVWEDFTACGAHTYWVRGVTKNDAFSDSNRVRASILIEYAQLVDLQDLKHPILLKCRRGEYPVLEGSVKPEGESVFYAGRKYPLFEFSEHLSEPLSMTFSYRKKSDFFKLVQIMQNSLPVLYRDYRGERCYLALTGLDYTTDPVSWDFTISATRVDYVEEIEYDPPEVVSE